MYFFDIDGSEYYSKRPGVSLKALTGESAQLCFVRLAPGTTTDHAHENEQIGYVLVGQVEITIGETSRVLQGGDGFIIPPRVPHAFAVLSDQPLEYLEVFCPPKPENDLRGGLIALD